MALSMCASCTAFAKKEKKNTFGCERLLPLCFVALIMFTQLTAKPALRSVCVYIYVNNCVPTMSPIKLTLLMSLLKD